MIANHPQQGQAIKTHGLTKVLADAICADDHFARDEGGKLYRYRDGAYRGQAERYVKARVKRLLEQWNYTKEWKPREANAVVEYIGVDARELWERPPLDTINVKNGLLRISDRVLLPHSPDHLSPVQLNVTYDPEATCPRIDQFVGKVFPPDAHVLAWEVPAWLMRPDASIQKAVLLTGEGANGKSTWLTLLTTFLGRRNTAAVSLHKLEANPFAPARLVGKLANICPDLPSSHLESTSTFKALVGNDTLNGEYKHKDSFEFEPFSRLVFSANHPPRSEDASHAFFRRWLVIPFDRTIEPSEAIPRDVLDAELSTGSELSGLLNKALDALPQMQSQHGFSEPKSVKTAWQEFHATTDPLAVWLDRYTVDHPDASVPKQTLRAAYSAECERRGRPALGESAFGRAFAKLRPQVETAQRTVGSKRQWCYVGIGMSHPDGDAQDAQANGDSGSHSTAHDAQDAQDNPLFDSEPDDPGEIQYSDLPVHPVHHVQEDCEEGGQHDWKDTAESDGKTRRFCTKCYRFAGFVQEDGSLIVP